MTDVEDLARRVAMVERGLAEQATQTLAVQTRVNQETELRQTLQKASVAIAGKFQQLEQQQTDMDQRIGAVETRGTDLTRLQQLIAVMQEQQQEVLNILRNQTQNNGHPGGNQQT